MFQPRHGKKWSQSEKWILGLSLPAILGLSWWSLRQPDRTVAVGAFKMTLVKTRFTRQARATILRPAVVAYARRATHFKRLVPLRISIELNHDGPRPDWWGHQDRADTNLWFRTKSGATFDTTAKAIRLRFDAQKQSYFVEGEVMMPDEDDFLQGSSCIGKGRIGFPPRYVDTQDSSASTTLNQSFRLLTVVKLDPQNTP